ncbi:MAG: polyprenyl synthetase family protein [Bacteroides sp.]|nr:polyprenyl synthetase family protein [Bacteroides sp.]MCM1380156.1 polyprenyl synthetase family protein [Bacteroides sp.]MCM1446464.1 polyprenyl synthetase family protein [Prevotella sp.]
MIQTDRLIETFEQAKGSLGLPDSLPGLYDPIRYTLEAGGKRLRPLLCLASCQACGVDAEEAVNQAWGIEMFHNFTLLHDDVMDRAEMRRGRPTVHKKWNEATAILSGDTMLTLATQLIARCPQEKLADMLGLFNSTAIKIYEGQQMDMDFETRTDVSEEEYLEMIRLKTAVLLSCAVEAGAMMAHAGAATRSALSRWAENTGMAFQLQDDYLDTFGDAETFGKIPGGDILNDKKTWLLITAIHEAPEAIGALIGTERSQSKIDAVKAVYMALNLPARLREQMERYAILASEALAEANIAQADKDWFANLSAGLLVRKL